jgi:hypothetical protein
MATLIALTAPTVAATSSTSTQMRHSQNVIRFFDNHQWLRAPNQPNCVSVPWTRSCRIARRVYIHHTNKLERLERAAWVNDQYNWRAWLPDKWARIGACETGYGQRPGNWRHNSGTYQGAFGFAVSSWDAFVPSADPKYGPYPSEAYEATPRQQYEVAMAIYRRYGLSGWGCRGA